MSLDSFDSYPASRLDPIPTSKEHADDTDELSSRRIERVLDLEKERKKNLIQHP